MSFYMRCINMYVNKKISRKIFSSGYYARINLKVYSSHANELRSLVFLAYRYPRGRIKLVCPSASRTLTGGAWGRDVTFDSVSSLYHIPGVTVYTDRSLVYAALGINQCYRD